MSRKIMVVSNQNNTRRMVESNATTREELEQELRNLGIETNGMSFFEGFSRTELTDPNSQLPATVMYKGRETTDLIIMLTPNAIKKVANGSLHTREELYKIIKEYGLEDDIKGEFGEHYTDLSTEILDEVVTDFERRNKEEPEAEEDEDEELAMLEQIKKLVDRLIEMRKSKDANLYNGFDIDEIAKNF